MSSSDRPKTPSATSALAEEIEKLIAGVGDPDVIYGRETDGYGKCVEAMWRAAYMAHELVAKRLGVTGFQHSISSLKTVGALRDLEGPYRLMDVSNALYPQYDLLRDTEEFLGGDDVRTWLADKAAEKLAAIEGEPEFSEWTDGDGVTHRVRRVHERVEQHWKRLVADRPVTPAEVSR